MVDYSCVGRVEFSGVEQSFLPLFSGVFLNVIRYSNRMEILLYMYLVSFFSSEVKD